MTPARCISGPNEHGDCWRACVASILNLPAAEVPNFAQLGAEPIGRMFELTREWLAERGLGMFHTYCSAGWTLEKLLECFCADNIDVPVIISGKSGGDPSDAHAVIAMNGKIVHDPSGAGVSGPWPCDCADPDCDLAWWWIDVIAFAAHSDLRRAATGEAE